MSDKSSKKSQTSKRWWSRLRKTQKWQPKFKSVANTSTDQSDSRSVSAPYPWRHRSRELTDRSMLVFDPHRWTQSSSLRFLKWNFANWGPSSLRSRLCEGTGSHAETSGSHVSRFSRALNCTIVRLSTCTYVGCVLTTFPHSCPTSKHVSVEIAASVLAPG